MYPEIPAHVADDRKHPFDSGTVFLLLAGLALSFYHLFNAQWFDYSNDAFEHRAYIEHIVERQCIPKPYEGAAYRHPATYYMAAAGAYSIGDAVAEEEGALIAVRLLSTAFYTVFLCYAALMLRRVASGAGYYAALALVAFWPMGMTLGARITCDIAMLACVAAVAYHVMRWQEHFDHAQLAAAFGWVAAGLLVKSNMLPWLPLMAGLVMIGRWRGHYAIRSLMRRDIGLALAAVALSAAGGLVRGNLFHYAAPQQPVFYAGMGQGLFSTFRFEPLTFLTTSIYRGINYYSEVVYFNLFLRSLAFDQFVWQSELFTLLVAVGMLGMILYLMIGLPWMLWRDPASRRSAGMLLLMLGGMLALLMLTYAAWRNPHYTNARYVYIIMPLFAALYGMVLQWHARGKKALLAWAGAVLAFGFSICSILLLVAQHVKWLRLDIAN